MRFHLLDIFRGLAAFWVLLHHYPYSSNLAESAPLLQNFVKNGHLGVCLFFVISGYCITASACKSIRVAESPNRFLQRRLFRILPPFWCSILVGVSIPFLLSILSLLKTGVWLSPDFSKVAHANFSWVDWFQIATLTRGFAWSQDSTLFGRWAGFNTPYWSLAIEAQFYVVVFLALKLKWNIRYFISIVTVASLISLAVPNFDQSGFFLPYWPTFGLGCFLFFAPQSRGGWQVIFKWLGVLAGIGCIFLSLSPIDFASQSKSLLMGAGFSIFLYPFNQVSAKKDDEPRARNSLTDSLMAVASILGAASYSIYLIHAKLFLIAIVFTRNVSLPDWFRDLSGILITLLGCLVFYFLFEKPFLHISSRRKPGA
ncbi:MAG: acyltransferase [Planctomycetota bacterium]|nr:acyltransferase [Planctomycetota bacterium]